MGRHIQKNKFTILKQVCELIPAYLVPKLTRKHRVQTRSFTSWSHVVSLIYAQLTHAIGLNDVCDALRNHRGLLRTVRGAMPPSKNGLSHANKTRSAQVAEELFWATLDHLQKQTKGFAGPQYHGVPRRFKKTIHAVDSTTIRLVAHCMDWAKHRRRKAAAKLHLRLQLQTFLPSFAIVDTAKHNDNKRARELCAGLKDGEICLFDKAYIDFEHLHDMDARGVSWVSRTKSNIKLRCVRKLLDQPKGKILRDDEVLLKEKKTREKFPKRMRRITALVEVDGQEAEMTFLTNNFEWAASTVCDLYQSRWGIETFFKQLKQSLQVCDFLGHSRNAIQWQVWTALLTYLLLRYLAFLSSWPHSFTRILTSLRAMLWSKLDLESFLKSYGTAGGRFRMESRPEQAYLPGFAPG